MNKDNVRRGEMGEDNNRRRGEIAMKTTGGDRKLVEERRRLQITVNSIAIAVVVVLLLHLLLFLFFVFLYKLTFFTCSQTSASVVLICIEQQVRIV